VIDTIRQGLKADGSDISISKLCRWVGVPRRVVYYRPVKSEPKLQKCFVAPIKAMIGENTPFGYRTVAHLLDFTKNTALVRGYRLRQEFITPHSPEQNGRVERVFRTLPEQCVHRYRFESLQHASRVIGDWIGFYNHCRAHQASAMRTPAAAFAAAA
jgi:putative transposase